MLVGSLSLQAQWKGFAIGNSGGSFIFSKSTVEEFQKLKIQSDVCGCHPGSPLHSASEEKLRHPGQSALHASFVRSLRGPAFGARKLLAVIPRLTPIGF